MSSFEIDTCITTEAEQLQMSNRMAIVERQLKRLVEESVEKMYIKGAISEVDGRLTAIETAQKSAVYEVDRRLQVLEAAWTPTVPESESRIQAMEDSLHDLGMHFGRYQQDLVEILAKKFQVFMRQMHAQEEKINAALQEAEANAKGQMMEEIDSNKDKGSDDGRDLSTRETASTVGSEESDKNGELDKVMYGELEKSMCDARKDIEIVWADLRAHADVTNKRILALEKSRETNPGITYAAAWEVAEPTMTARTLHQNIQDLIDQGKAAAEVPCEYQFKPPPLPSYGAKSATGEVQPMSFNELEIAFQGLTSAVGHTLGQLSPEQQALGQSPLPMPNLPTSGQGLPPIRTMSPNSSVISVPSSQVEAISKDFEASVERIRTLSTCRIGSQPPMGSKPTPCKKKGVLEPSFGTVSSDGQKTISLTPKFSQSEAAQEAPRTVSVDVPSNQHNLPVAEPIASNNVASPLKTQAKSATSGPPSGVSDRLGVTMTRTPGGRGAPLSHGISMRTPGLQVTRDPSPRIQSARANTFSPVPHVSSGCSPGPSLSPSAYHSV